MKPDAIHAILLADNVYSVATAAHRRAIRAGQHADLAGTLSDEEHSVFMLHLNGAGWELLAVEPHVNRLRTLGRGAGLLHLEDGDQRTRDYVEAAVMPTVEAVLIAAGKVIESSRAAEKLCGVDNAAPTRDARLDVTSESANDEKPE